MTDWHALRDAYGAADAVPMLLDRISPTPTDPAWDELWSRLCHQGTVYPASFAALPLLESLARSWSAQERDVVLHLAGAIVCSTDRVGIDGDPLRPLTQTVKRLQSLGSESLMAGHRSEEAFVYLLQAVLGLEGDAIWGARLDGLVDGELAASCPKCESELYVVIDRDGGFVTTDEWIDRPHVARAAIVSGARPLQQPGEWIREQAAAAGQSDVAARIGYLFGASSCPACSAPIQIADAIASNG